MQTHQAMVLNLIHHANHELYVLRVVCFFVVFLVVFFCYLFCNYHVIVRLIKNGCFFATVNTSCYHFLINVLNCVSSHPGITQKLINVLKEKLVAQISYLATR